MEAQEEEQVSATAVLRYMKILEKAGYSSEEASLMSFVRAQPEHSSVEEKKKVDELFARGLLKKKTTGCS